MCVPPALGSGGAVMEMRCALQYCTPKRAWVGARWKTCSPLTTTEHRGSGSNPREKLGDGLLGVRPSLTHSPRGHLSCVVVK